MEGVRFGLIMGLVLSIPAACGDCMIILIPYYLALEWFLPQRICMQRNRPQTEISETVN